MSRTKRFVVPGIPHHVVQRGNRRQTVFFTPEDRIFYLDLLGVTCRNHGLRLQAYCLMDNHVHLLLQPTRAEDLSPAMREVAMLYSSRINRTNGWTGCLWQGPYRSFPLDEVHTVRVVKYIERNPVRAGLTVRPQDFKWSSAANRIERNAGAILDAAFIAQCAADWHEYLNEAESPEWLATVRRHTRTGRPLGSNGFLRRIEALTGRAPMGKPIGRPPRSFSLIERSQPGTPC